MDPSDLRRHARIAYERGRFRGALPWAVPGLVMAALTFGLVGNPASWGLGAVLAALSVGMIWRGGDLGRGVLPGLIAGSPAWLVPVLWECRMGACSASCSVQCTVLAAVSGVVGGLLLWRRVGQTSAVVALVLAGTAASMSCAALGASGLAGVIAVMVAGAPTLVWRPSPA